MVTKDINQLDDQAMTSIQRVALYEDNQPKPSMIARLDFNFSYKRREKMSKEQLVAIEDQKQLERLR
jgi:hypothetical protein